MVRSIPLALTAVLAASPASAQVRATPSEPTPSAARAPADTAPGASSTPSTSLLFASPSAAGHGHDGVLAGRAAESTRLDAGVESGTVGDHVLVQPASVPSLRADPSGGAAGGMARSNTHSEPTQPALAMPTWGSLFGDLPHDTRRLFSKGNALWLGGAGVLALAVHDQDARLTRRAVASAGLDTTLEAGALLGGGIIQVGGALGTFAVGRWSGNAHVASVGSDLVRAQIINTVLTQGIKVSVGRRRPDGTRFSFPSGHASSSFTTATVLQRRLGWRIGIPAYAMATYVAVSRLQENRHYLSDVVFGAGLGIIAGRSVTARLGRHRFTLVPLASPDGMGIGLMRQ